MSTKEIRYEGLVPKSLRQFADKHAHMIYEIAAGDGWNTRTGFGYDIAYRNGFGSGSDVVHSDLAETVKEAIGYIRAAGPCDCEACQKGESYGGST